MFRQAALLVARSRGDATLCGAKSTAARSFATLPFLPARPHPRKSPPRASSGPLASTLQPPPLPDASIVRVGTDCALEYIDLAPRTATSPSPSHQTPTLVLLHGAPGTYRDYRHLIPQLQHHLPSARIVGINFPGFGGSRVDETRYFELLDAQRASHLTLRALQQLLGPQGGRVVLVGHSFGGHAALSLAALNITSPAPDAPPLTVAGLVLLAAAGSRPHRVLRPRQSAAVTRALQSAPAPVRHALAVALKAFYTVVLRFPPDFPASHFVAGIVRASTTDFNVVQQHVELLRGARVRSLSAWSRDDAFMEDEIPTALAAALRSDKRLAFDGAGHNLQKTRAEELAREIARWVAHDRAPVDDAAEVEVETRP